MPPTIYRQSEVLIDNLLNTYATYLRRLGQGAPEQEIQQRRREYLALYEQLIAACAACAWNDIVSERCVLPPVASVITQTTNNLGIIRYALFWGEIGPIALTPAQYAELRFQSRR